MVGQVATPAGAATKGGARSRSRSLSRLERRRETARSEEKSRQLSRKREKVRRAGWRGNEKVVRSAVTRDGWRRDKREGASHQRRLESVGQVAVPAGTATKGGAV